MATLLALVPWMAAFQAAGAVPAVEPPAVDVSAYGLLVTNFFYNTDSVVNNDVPLASGADDGVTIDSLGATARQSRFGVRVKAATVASALSADAVEGVFEVDFFGGHYPNNNNSYYMQLLPRLRLFAVAMTWAETKVVVGQDWAVFAPLNADSLNHMVLPPFSNTGNLWNRLPQARLERQLGAITLIGGVLAPADASPTAAPLPLMDPTGPEITSNLPTPVRNPSAAERSRLPSLEARVAYGAALAEQPLTVGLSGHLGAEKVAANAMATPAVEESTVVSYGVAADLTLPLGSLVTVKAEAFLGQDLDGFFSNAAIAGPDGGGEMQAVRVLGGFAQVGVKPGKVGLFAGVGIEDPDAPGGVSLATNAVQRNLAVYGAVTYALGPKLNVGVELDHLRTRRVGAGDQGTANHIDATLQFGF